MALTKLALFMSLLILITFGAELSSKKEYVLLTFDYDPFPKSIPGWKKWMENFSTQSPLKYIFTTRSKDETIAKCEQNTRPLEELQVEPSAEPSTDLNIFDMLMSTKKETTLLPTSAVKELNDAFDDENIESASQVSGPVID